MNFKCQKSVCIHCLYTIDIVRRNIIMLMKLFLAVGLNAFFYENKNGDAEMQSVVLNVVLSNVFCSGNSQYRIPDTISF